MKKIIIGLLAIGLIAGGYYYFLSSSEPDVQFTSQTYSFVSADGDFTVRYDDSGDHASLSGVGETYQLNRAISASGARYTNQDESVIFWEHAGEATITINGNVYETASEASLTDADVDPELIPDEEQSPVVNTVWQWVDTTYSDGTETTTPAEPEAFQLSFTEAGQFSATTDCNNAFGAYELTDSQLTFSQMASTKMACLPDTQEAEYVAMLSTVDSFSIDEAGNLSLSLSDGVETMHFSPVE